MTAIPEETLAILRQGTCAGNVYHLPPAQLDRRFYESCNKALEFAGGKWNKSAKGHVFDGDAAEILAPILESGEVRNTKKEIQFFASPKAVVEYVFDRVEILPDMRCLEPSAGTGALAIPMLERGAIVDVCDSHLPFIHKLMYGEHDFNALYCQDFLTLTPEVTGYYDAVVMNPPFTIGQDADHATHALQFLKKGGTLASIISPAYIHRSDRRYLDFRQLMEENKATLHKLPENSFKESGTGIDTWLVVFKDYGVKR